MSSGFLGNGIGPSAFGGSGELPAPVPVAGAELLINGGFDNGSSWGFEAPFSISGGTANKAATGTASLSQGTSAAHTWYQIAFDVVSISGGTIRSWIGGGAVGANRTAPGSYLDILRHTSNFTFALNSNDSACVCSVDNFSVKQLSISSLFSTRAYASANCDLSAAVTRTASTQAGFVARLDSASSPANFLIAYLDGAGNVKVDKCVAGTYTNVISGAITYAAGRVLRLVCSGNSVSCYYNGTQVGSTVTVSDAGIVSNTRHGLFSTYAANSFAGYVAA